MKNVFKEYRKKLFENKRKKEVEDMLNDIKTLNNMKKVSIKKLVEDFKKNGDVFC